MKRKSNKASYIPEEGVKIDVKVLDYDRDRYYTIELPSGEIVTTKAWSLIFDKGFSRHHIPYDYKQGYFSNKEIAADLRLHKRYHYKYLSPTSTVLTLSTYDSPLSSNLSTVVHSVSGTRKKLRKFLRSYPTSVYKYMNLSLSSHYKLSSSHGTLLKHEDGIITVYCDSRKKSERTNKQIRRSIFGSSKYL